eukprot:6480353-Prymnesium_polylepis.1
MELSDTIFRERGRKDSEARAERKKAANAGKTLKQVSSHAELFSGPLSNALTALLDQCVDAISTINMRTATATVAGDRDAIFALVEASIGLDVVTEETRSVVRGCILRWQASALDSWVRIRGKGQGQWAGAAEQYRKGWEGGELLVVRNVSSTSSTGSSSFRPRSA